MGSTEHRTGQTTKYDSSSGSPCLQLPVCFVSLPGVRQLRLRELTKQCGIWSPFSYTRTNHEISLTSTKNNSDISICSNQAGYENHLSPILVDKLNRLQQSQPEQHWKARIQARCDSPREVDQDLRV